MIECVSWDFSDTLAGEQWMLAPSDGLPNWIDQYRQQVFEPQRGLDWRIGTVGMDDVAAQMSVYLGQAEERRLFGCC
ncbi:MAG: hypothetical protein ACTSX7_02620 [Alphaproteobacteria bacterium]